MNKAIISIDLNITRFTNEMYENLIDTISLKESAGSTSDKCIDIYLYNYIPKKYPFVTEGANIHIYDYNGSKKKVALDIFQSLNTLSECLKNDYKTVYLLCGAVDRDILINVLQNHGVQVVLLVQENSSTSICRQMIIDRILPNPEYLSTLKGNTQNKTEHNNDNLQNIATFSYDSGSNNAAKRIEISRPMKEVSAVNLNAKKEFLFNTNIKPNDNLKLIDAESKLKILLEALTKSKSNSLKDEYNKLLSK